MSEATIANAQTKVNVPTEAYAWYCGTSTNTLRYGDNRLITVGETHELGGGAAPEMCKLGMHASKYAYSAFQYGGTGTFYRVKLEEIVEERVDDGFFGPHKYVGKKRTYLQKIVAKPLFRQVIVNLVKNNGWYWNCKHEELNKLKPEVQHYILTGQNREEVLVNLPSFDWVRYLTDFDVVDNPHAVGLMFNAILGNLTSSSYKVKIEIEKVFQAAIEKDAWKTEKVIKDAEELAKYYFDY